MGLAGGVAAGGALVANAATSHSPDQPASSLASGSPGSGSSNGSAPSGPPMGGPHRPGGFGMDRPVVHSQATVQGPNGFETVDERTGTVSNLSDTSGGTWSLTVKSADGTTGTFTVNSGTSVNGGETGISSVKQGDTVRVVATESNGAATAKVLVDRTVLQNNGNSWMPRPPSSSG